MRWGILGKLWTLPNTLLGLGLGALGMLGGARPARGRNAILFLDHPLLPITPARAITFGNVVLYRRGARPRDTVRTYDGRAWQRMEDHEAAHTLQYQLWGPLFLPVYLVLVLFGRPHRLELQADRWAAGGGPGRKGGGRPAARYAGGVADPSGSEGGGNESTSTS